MRLLLHLGESVVPTRDIIHDAVKNALIKDGWTITADPYVIAYEDVTLFADGGERPGGRAGRAQDREVKSFLSPSPIYDLKMALGHYELYRGYLKRLNPTANCSWQ